MSNFVFDIDGTLSKNGQKIDATIAGKLIEISKQHTVIFASARPIRDMLPLIPEAFHHGGLIGCNGAIVFQNNRPIVFKLLEKNIAVAVLDCLKQNNVAYVLDGKWHYALSKTKHQFHDYIKQLSRDEVSEAEILQDGIIKILILSNAHKDVIANISENMSITHHRHDDFYDVTAANNNKYHALLELIKHQPYYAFGNDENDFMMLDKAEIATFVGEASLYPSANYHANIDNIAETIDFIMELEERKSFVK